MFSSPDDSPQVVPFPGFRGHRQPRERILEAMLAASGERGFERTAVRHVIERAAYEPRHLLQALRGPRRLLRPGLRRDHRVALPPAHRHRQAPAVVARGPAGGAGGAARVLRQSAADRESARGRGPCRGRALAQPATRSDGAPLPRAGQRAPRDSLSPSSTSCCFRLHCRGDRHAPGGEADGRRRRPRAADAPGPAALHSHAVPRRGRRLGRADRGAPLATWKARRATAGQMPPGR